MRGDLPGTRSNVNDVGFCVKSLTVSVHELTVGWASKQFLSHPCRYFARGGASTKEIPSASQSVVAYSIPPGEVSAPSSKIGLRLRRSVSNPFTENTT